MNFKYIWLIVKLRVSSYNWGSILVHFFTAEFVQIEYILKNIFKYNFKIKGLMTNK